MIEPYQASAITCACLSPGTEKHFKCDLSSFVVSGAVTTSLNTIQALRCCLAFFFIVDFVDKRLVSHSFVFKVFKHHKSTKFSGENLPRKCCGGFDCPPKTGRGYKKTFWRELPDTLIFAYLLS